MAPVSTHRQTLVALGAAILVAAAGFGIGSAASTTQALPPGDNLTVTCSTTMTGMVHTGDAMLACASSAASTATPSPAGWHAPTTHEHGDAPPAWVLASNQQPFTQTRESHTGYKGVYAKDRGGKGVESYLITHILSSEMARMHGDHDYQVWFRAPNGTVLAQQGLLDFSSSSSDITAPIRESKVDDGKRPTALAERTSTDGCETWYDRPGALIFDLGWTICGRYQKFDGTILGGVGVVRTMDWVLVADRLPAGHPLRTSCTVEFGTCRHSFLVNTKSYAAPGIVPIN